MSLSEEQEIIRLFVEESQDNINGLENDLLAIEASGADIDEELVNKVFRAVHSIKGGAGFVGLATLKELAHAMEEVLNRIRNRALVPAPEVIGVLLAAGDQLTELVNNATGGPDIDISATVSRLRSIESNTSGPGAGADEAHDMSPSIAEQTEEDVPEIILDEMTGDQEEKVSESAEPDDLEPESKVETIVPGQEEPEILPDRSETVSPSPSVHVPEESPKQKPVKDSKKAAEPVPGNNRNVASESLRVNVKLLDKLMTLAGELVLTRNRLMQTVSNGSIRDIEDVSQRLNLITSDLQEAIMSTRMQPIGNVFNKFHRVVRDLARQVGKQVDLELEGEDVDLDKTIIEAIADPLTHMVRNSVDHGIETPDERRSAGKDPVGRLKLSAYHEAGQVTIEIRDDGRGIDPDKIKAKALAMGIFEPERIERMNRKELVTLIFAPGFSTASRITDVSGRGVGMDVVLTNLKRLNGEIDIDSTKGKGTTIRIKLPLTLAIIPSLIVGLGEERFAIPQVNLVELIRIPPSEVAQRIEEIGSAQVIRLRGKLLPLVRLSDALGLSRRLFTDPETGEIGLDRRERIADRRTAEPAESMIEPDKRESRRDRRYHTSSSYNIAVVAVGNFHYGLIVDTLLDSEEIVVKPLGRHLRKCRAFAGATIQGDGSVALILDVAGISRILDISSVQEQAAAEKRQKSSGGRENQSFLVIRNTPQAQFAIPLNLVARIEKIRREDVETISGRGSLKYRGGSLPLCSIEEVANVPARMESEEFFAVIFSFSGFEVGFLTAEIVDVVDSDVNLDDSTFRGPGILGSTIIMERTTLLVDVYGIARQLMPNYFKSSIPAVNKESGPVLLVVEDSDFFRGHIKSFLEEAGYKVLTACDGTEGLESLESHADEISAVITDIEMPNLDGIEMTRRIREQLRFASLPVIAVTSLTGSEAETKGLEAGINDYLIKLDQNQILEKLQKHLELKTN